MSQAQAHDTHKTAINHYQVAAAIVDLKHSLGVSNKTWDKALKLMAMEIDSRSSWKGAEQPAQFASTKQAPEKEAAPAKELVPSRGPAKKTKKEAPQPNPVKKSHEYLALQATHDNIVAGMKQADAKGLDLEQFKANLKRVETDMKILRGRPNDKLSGANALDSSTGSALDEHKEDGTNKSRATASAILAAARAPSPAAAKVAEQNKRTPSPSRYRGAVLTHGVVMTVMNDSELAKRYINSADYVSIWNAMENGNFHTEAALIERFREARKDFEVAAAARVANGGNRHL